MAAQRGKAAWILGLVAVALGLLATAFGGLTIRHQIENGNIALRNLDRIHEESMALAAAPPGGARDQRIAELYDEQQLFISMKAEAESLFMIGLAIVGAGLLVLLVGAGLLIFRLVRRPQSGEHLPAVTG